MTFIHYTIVILEIGRAATRRFVFNRNVFGYYGIDIIGYILRTFVYSVIILQTLIYIYNVQFNTYLFFFDFIYLYA